MSRIGTPHFNTWLVLVSTFSLFTASTLLAEEVAIPAAVSRPPEVAVATDPQVAERFDFADGLFGRGFYSMAAPEYEKLIADHPGHARLADAYFRKAESHFFQKEYETALLTYQAFGEKFPADVRASSARQRLGEILFQMERYDEALGYLQKLSLAKGEHSLPVVNYYVARIYFHKHAWAISESHFKKVLEVWTENPYREYATYYLAEIAMEQGDTKGAKQRYEQASKLENKELAQLSYFGMGKVAFDGADYVNAAEAFDKAVSMNAIDGLREDALLNSLKARFNGKAHEELTKVFDKRKKYLVTPVKEVEALLLVGNALAERDLFEESNDYFSKVINHAAATDTEKYKASLMRVENLMTTQNSEAALGELEALISDGTDDERILYLKAAAFRETGRWEDAVRVADELLKRFPKSDYTEEVLLNKAFAGYSLGDYKVSLRALNTFLDQYPDHELADQAMHDRVLVYVKANLWEDAVESATEYLKIYPQGKHAKKISGRLGSFYTELERFEAAYEYYKSHLEGFELTASETSETLFYMAYNKQLAGDLSGAAALYDQTEKQLLPAEMQYAAFKNVAYCYMNLEKFEQASDRYYDLVIEFPDNDINTEVYFWMLGQLLERKQSKRVRNAIANFNRPQDRALHLAEIEYYLGESYYLDKDYAEASVHYEKCANEHSLYEGDALLGLGLSYVKIGDKQKAVVYFQQALSGAGEDYGLAIRSRIEMADVFFDSAEYERAAKAYFAIGILYEDAEMVPRALFRAGESFRKAGNEAEALKVFEELTLRFEEHPLSQQARQILDKASA